MRKILLRTIFVVSIIVMLLTLPALADQSTELPVVLRHNTSYGRTHDVTLDSFHVNDVRLISDTQIRIGINLDYTDSSSFGYLYMEVNCYDDSGFLIDTVPFNSYNDYIDAPLNTATIELTMESPAPGHTSYLYRNFTNVYAPDGRALTITDLQVPLYESVGWKPPVYMFAPVDGEFTRSILVSPFEVAAHEAVGWYTTESVIFHEFKNLYYNSWKPATDYDSVFKAAELVLPSLIGTKYENEVYLIRAEARELWQKHCGKPMGVIEHYLDKDDYGTPELTIGFRNLSFKKIIAYKVNFTCYDVFGNVQDTHYDYYYDDDADLGVVEATYATWDLDYTDSVRFVKNINVFEVVFEDGTKWTGKK